MAQKIIVIDDESLILKTIEKALTKVGYDVTSTSKPDEFIEALTNKGADLMIVDLHIRGANTEAMMAKAMGIAPDAKVLIISGSVADVSPENYLQKPFQISELRTKVQELLNEP